MTLFFPILIAFTFAGSLENDADNDGIVDAVDCRPLNPNPYASRRIWHLPDSDSDGYGSPPGAIHTCLRSVTGYVRARGARDCNDTDADINPGATEVPYDTFDNDCDITTPDDDLDNDGLILADDCDDTDASILECPTAEIIIVSLGPSAGYASSGDLNVSLLELIITSDADVLMEDVPIKFCADDDGDGDPPDEEDDDPGASDLDDDGLINTGGHGNITNLKIAESGGTVIAGPLELDTDAGDSDACQTVIFEADEAMTPGSALALVIEVDIGASVGAIFTASLITSDVVISQGGAALDAGDFIPSVNIDSSTKTVH